MWANYTGPSLNLPYCFRKRLYLISRCLKFELCFASQLPSHVEWENIVDQGRVSVVSHCTMARFVTYRYCDGSRVHHLSIYVTHWLPYHLLWWSTRFQDVHQLKDGRCENSAMFWHLAPNSRVTQLKAYDPYKHYLMPTVRQLNNLVYKNTINVQCTNLTPEEGCAYLYRFSAKARYTPYRVLRSNSNRITQELHGLLMGSPEQKTNNSPTDIPPWGNGRWGNTPPPPDSTTVGNTALPLWITFHLCHTHTHQRFYKKTQ